LTLLIPCNRQFLTKRRIVTENSKTPAQWPTVLMRIGSHQVSQIACSASFYPTTL
jgi:hypothetical protein